MSTSIKSRARRFRSQKYTYGAGGDPVANAYRHARESLRSAREFKVMYDVLKGVPGRKRAAKMVHDGYKNALKSAAYWRDHARWARRNVPQHLRTR